MRLRATCGLMVTVLATAALAACAESESGPPSSDAAPDPAAAFDGERAEIAEALVAYGDTVESGENALLCRDFLPEPKSIYERRNDCSEDPDSDARIGDVPSIAEIERIELVPQDPRSDRIPDEIDTYLAEWALKDLAAAYAVVRDGEGQMAFGLDKIEGEWRVVSRMAARDAKPPPSGKERRRFFGAHGVLGAFGIVEPGVSGKCDEAGSVHVDGTVTDVDAASARQAILKSELVGKAARDALDRGGVLELRSVDFRNLTRTFVLTDDRGGVATIPVEGNGPRYYVNNYGGCTDNPLAKELFGYGFR